VSVCVFVCLFEIQHKSERSDSELRNQDQFSAVHDVSQLSLLSICAC